MNTMSNTRRKHNAKLLSRTVYSITSTIVPTYNIQIMLIMDIFTHNNKF